MPTNINNEIITWDATSDSIDSSYYTAISATTGITATTGTYSAYTPIAVSFIDKNEEKIKEYTEKTDKHIDELEEDIEYLNKERAEQEIKITSLQLETNKLRDTVEELCNKIRLLETYTHYLENEIITKEDKTSE